jgi:hypothetical protein
MYRSKMTLDTECVVMLIDIYAECIVCFIVKVSAVSFSVIMLNAVMLHVLFVLMLN